MLEELKMPIAQLKEDIDGVWSRLEPDAIQKKIDEKNKLTEADGFWDDHEKAEKVMAEIRKLKNEIKKDPETFRKQVAAIKSLSSMMNPMQRAKLESLLRMLEE